MHRSRLLLALSVAFGLMSVALGVAGLVYNFAILAPAAMFAVVTYVLWAHGTGRLAARVYRRVERRAATNGGHVGGTGRSRRDTVGSSRRQPREQAASTRDGQQRRHSTQRTERTRDTRHTGANRGEYGRRTTGRRPPRSERPSMSPGEAAAVLGVDPDADQETIRRAYRQQVKAVHPDADTGDTESFKRVRTAYERLRE